MIYQLCIVMTLSYAFVGVGLIPYAARIPAKGPTMREMNRIWYLTQDHQTNYHWMILLLEMTGRHFQCA